MVDMDTVDMVMVMARGLLMLSQDMAMVMDMELLLSMCPRLTMDMVITHNLTLTDITLDTDMVRGLLKLSQDMVMAMLPATPTEAHRVSMDTTVVMDMVMDTVVMDTVMVMARGLLMLDTMVVLALMSIRPVLTTMDLTDMVSTTMARGQLMLDILVMDMEDMEWLAATSMLTGHTLPMVLVLLTLTK